MSNPFLQLVFIMHTFLTFQAPIFNSTSLVMNAVPRSQSQTTFPITMSFKTGSIKQTKIFFTRLSNKDSIPINVSSKSNILTGINKFGTIRSVTNFIRKSSSD